MARPPARELTERELEVMHVFWERGEMTADQARELLGEQGRELAYTTVATLIRILVDKGFLKVMNDRRPFLYRPVRSFRDVSGSLLGDLLERVFGGSREELLMRLMEHRKLSAKERAMLKRVLREDKP